MKCGTAIVISADIEDSAARSAFQEIAKIDGEVREHTELLDERDEGYNRRNVCSFCVREKTDEESPSNAITAIFRRLQYLVEGTNTLEQSAQRYGAAFSCYVAAGDSEPLWFSAAQVAILSRLRCDLGVDIE